MYSMSGGAIDIRLYLGADRQMMVWYIAKRSGRLSTFRADSNNVLQRAGWNCIPTNRRLFTASMRAAQGNTSTLHLVFWDMGFDCEGCEPKTTKCLSVSHLRSVKPHRNRCGPKPDKGGFIGEQNLVWRTSREYIIQCFKAGLTITGDIIVQPYILYLDTSIKPWQPGLGENSKGLEAVKQRQAA